MRKISVAPTRATPALDSASTKDLPAGRLALYEFRVPKDDVSSFKARLRRISENLGGRSTLLDVHGRLGMSTYLNVLVSEASLDLLDTLDAFGTRRSMTMNYAAGRTGDGFEVESFRVRKDAVPKFKTAISDLAVRLGAKVRIEDERWRVGNYATIQFSYRDASPAFEAAVEAMSVHFSR